MTLEGKLKDEVKAYLKSLGPSCWYYMPVPMGYGKRGVPDFIICYRGFFIGAETKKAGGKNQPWQDNQQTGIRVAGGRSGWITDLQWLKDCIRDIDAYLDQVALAWPMRF